MKHSIFASFLMLSLSIFGQPLDSTISESFDSFNIPLEQVGDTYYSWDCVSQVQTFDLIVWLDQFPYEETPQSFVSRFRPSKGFDDMVWARVYHLEDDWIVVAFLMIKDDRMIAVGNAKIKGTTYWK